MLTAAADRVPLFAKLLEGTDFQAPGWSRVTWGGMGVFGCMVPLHGRPPDLRADAHSDVEFRPRILIEPSRREAGVPWSWLFRDYLGFEPTVVGGGNAFSPGGSACVRLAGTASPIAPTEGPSVICLSGPEADTLHSLHIVRRHPATAPFAAGEVVPFRGGCHPLHVKGLLPLVTDEHGQVVCGALDSPARSVVLGFDPVEALWHDSRLDAGPLEAALNGNWIMPILGAIVWASDVIAWKGLWPEGIPPLLYSVDVEAATSYFDVGEGRCVWAVNRHHARRPQDTKLSDAIDMCMTRLGHARLLGTFHIELNAVYDEEDRGALKRADRQHDVAFHMPRLGGHEAWTGVMGDSTQVEAACRGGLRELEGIVDHQARGFRNPSWRRAAATHDGVAAAGLGYDSSSFAQPPFAAVPHRMFSSERGEPLDLWEFPCVEVIGIVKAGPSRLKGLRSRRRNRSGLEAYIRSSAQHGGLVVLADHDMALGAAPRHVHGNWRLDPAGQRWLLRAAQRDVARNGHQVMRGRDLLSWWAQTRDLRLSWLREDATRTGFFLALNWPPPRTPSATLKGARSNVAARAGG